ncbi:hypothetical protein MPSEU_000948700 [Mayamaea pseudoterrestris]|nr:hypothetical protein MPSEU_000948700 [Mayamaea pseudoterrestris]
MSNETATSTAVNDSPTTIIEDTNDEGIVVSYKCNYHVKTGAIASSNGKEINSFYEMLLPCRDDPEDAMRTVASELLDSLGNTFGLLPDGSACTIPDTTLDAWVIGEASAPADSVVSHMDCSKLSMGDNQELCCIVVEAPMTFWVSSTNFKDQDVLKYVASDLNAGAFTYQTAYIGSMIQYTGNAGTDQVPTFPDDDPVIAGIANSPNTSAKNTKSPITILGGFLVAALVIVVVFGIAVVTIRRRRQNRKYALEEKEMADKDSLKYSKDDDSIGHVSFDVGQGIANMHQLHSRGMATTATSNSFGLDNPTDDCERPQSYTFDIANSMKNHIMSQYGSSPGRGGSYGPNGTAAFPPYAMEETSDSEVDSWAQTEGTVGSLEENLEQITAEI